MDSRAKATGGGGATVARALGCLAASAAWLACATGGPGAPNYGWGDDAGSGTPTGFGDDGGGGQPPGSSSSSSGGQGPSPDAAQMCTPETCHQIGATCGAVADGCGGLLNCGTCPSGQMCGGGGAPNTCGSGPCTPTTCAKLGATCGPTGDGCGGMLDCGTCNAPQTCSGGGKPNQCGCLPATSCGSVTCGAIPDGCGGMVACGSCPSGQACSGGQCASTSSSSSSGGSGSSSGSGGSSGGSGSSSGGSGGPCWPVSAFDASPVSGNACGTANALAQDGTICGLDDAAGLGSLAGQTVAGCVGVDFGQTLPALSPVTVHAGASPDACSGADPCLPGYCNTGDSFQVFTGTTLGSYTYETAVNLSAGTALSDYGFAITQSARYLVVCRPGNGYARDNIAVDSIRGCQ